MSIRRPAWQARATPPTSPPVVQEACGVATPAQPWEVMNAAHAAQVAGVLPRARTCPALHPAPGPRVLLWPWPAPR